MLNIENIENILNNYTKINLSIFDNYSKYGYPSKETLYDDLYFLVDNIYHTTIIDPCLVRLSPDEFKNTLLNKYNKCIISENNYYDELEACPIVDVYMGGDFMLNNGFILEANLYKTFVKNLWCINPYTKLIEIKEDHYSSINKYINKSINIDKIILDNLIIRYKEFKNNT